jgi:U3 small nucleolar RNA-associated protein 6
MNKFRYDLSLWKQYLGFCYTIRSKKQFNKAVTHVNHSAKPQALSLLPYEIDLWLLAAYFEFET